MRIQVSRRQVMQNYFCISVGYCELQSLLKYVKSPYYTTGVYGWNFDAYPFEFHGMNVCITTGYRGMVSNCKNAYTYQLGHEYDEKADQILADNDGNKKERLDTLIQEFLAVVFAPLLEKGSK